MTPASGHSLKLGGHIPDARDSSTTCDLKHPRASFWRRFSGLLLDSTILIVIDELLRLIVGNGIGRPLSIVLALIYFTGFVGSQRGQTPGMRAMRIRVISAGGGGPIGYKRATIRWLGGYISAAALLLGFLWMLWDEEKQCWHDKLAAAFVVRTHQSLPGLPG
jgi:uncharacterized RDD family membrane protein YckC